MSRITKYAIITGKDSQDLACKVNEKLAEGWRPQGSLVVSGGNFLQPVVCRQKPEKRIRKTSED